MSVPASAIEASLMRMLIAVALLLAVTGCKAQGPDSDRRHLTEAYRILHDAERR